MSQNEAPKIKRTILEIDWSKVPILNERPPLMSREDYKLHQKAYKYLLKQYKSQGRYISGYEVESPKEEDGVQGE